METKDQPITADEFLKKLWLGYPKDLCHGRPGTRPNAEKAVKKIKPSEYKRILMNLEALKKYDRQDMKPDRWPHLSTWLNQGYYDRELGSMTELKEKQALSICSKPNCNRPVHGESFKTCTNHTTEGDRDAPRRKEALEKLGLYREGMTFAELSRKCREYLLASGKSGMDLVLANKDLSKL